MKSGRSNLRAYQRGDDEIAASSRRAGLLAMTHHSSLFTAFVLDQGDIYGSNVQMLPIGAIDIALEETAGMGGIWATLWRAAQPFVRVATKASVVAIVVSAPVEGYLLGEKLEENAPLLGHGPCGGTTLAGTALNVNLDPAISLSSEAEHTKNPNPANWERHSKGQHDKKLQNRGEKGDPKRPYQKPAKKPHKLK